MTIVTNTASAFRTANTLLDDGQFGYETDTGLRKIGDGTTTWNSLSYTTQEVPWGSTESGVFTVPSSVLIGVEDRVQLSVQGYSTQTSDILLIENSAGTDLLSVNNSGNITLNGTVDGRDLATDGTKLDGVEALADVTDATNVAAAGAVMDSDFSVNGIVVRTADGAYTNRSVAAGSTKITVTDGDGVSGNITIDAAEANINHNTLLNYLANEHIDWTSTTSNLSTSGTAATGALTVTGNIVVTGTVDGRDVLADGTKLDGVEALATADQTGAEIKTAYELEADTNAFTDADHSKLDGIEALADVTDSTNVLSSLSGQALAVATIDTGNGAVECYAMNQDVETTDDVTFAHAIITGSGATTGVSITQSGSGTALNIANSGSGALVVVDTTALVVDTSGNVGIGTASPTTSTALDITSTTGALLLPRMTTTERNSLTAANGMLIYNTTDSKLQGYEGGAWANLV